MSIDTEAFRRMQHIKQLSHAYLVYPSAVHTRFEHQVGTMHVAGIMARLLGMSQEEIDEVRMAGLVHDIGHGPFSHLFERVMLQSNDGDDNIHERISGIIITEDDEISNVLGDMSDPVLEILGHRNRTGLTSQIQSEIISGSLDADRMDYLRRDSYHIGVKYGEFDFERMVHSLVRADQPDPNAPDGNVSKLCVGPKGIHVVESLRLARYMMHAQVYEHHTRLSADQMFLRALRIAISDSVIDGNLLKIKKDGNNEEFLEFYKSLDDSSIYQMIIKNDPSSVPATILADIRRRNLLKRACDFTAENLTGHDHIFDSLLKQTPENYEEMCLRISEAAGVPSHRVIFHRSTIKNKSYVEPIFYKSVKNLLHYLDSISPIAGLPTTNRFYVFGPPSVEIRRKIAKATAREIGIDVELISEL
ncbi:MAG: HD domain-containing protein [Nitrosopumilus sp.]|nr:HD domain-containing protein [Nitrosopumilus sp.]